MNESIASVDIHTEEVSHKMIGKKIYYVVKRFFDCLIALLAFSI